MPERPVPKSTNDALRRVELRLLHRLLMGEAVIAVVILLVFAAALLAFVSATHAQNATHSVRQQVQTLAAQVGTVKGQVGTLQKLQNTNNTEVLKNRNTGLDSRVVSCSVLKAVQPALEKSLPQCKGLPSTSPTP